MSETQSAQANAPLTSTTVQPAPAVQSQALGYQPNYPNDEIDLVELLGFFWKIKLEIVVGAVVGELIGLAVAYKVLPVSYRTQIPLVLDKNEINVDDPKKLVENFNNAINVSDVSRLVWRSVFNQSPELARTLKDNGLNDEVLASHQTLADKPENAPLRLRESASPRDFVLDVNLPVQGLNQRSGELFASAIQMALASNATVPEPDSDNPAQLTNANTPSAAPALLAPVGESSEMREQLLRLRQELLKIEYMSSKLGQGLPEFGGFVKTSESQAKPFQVSLAAPADARDYFEQMTVQTQFERIQRMVAALLAEGRVTAEDANDTVTRAMQIRDEMFQLIPDARVEGAQALKASMKLKGIEVGGRRLAGITAALPSLVPANAAGEALSLEVPTSKRKIALVLGVFLGAFAGFALGGGRIFIQKNGQRLREVMAK